MVLVRLGSRLLKLALVVLAFALALPSSSQAQSRTLFSSDATNGAVGRAANGDPMVVRTRRATADVSLLAAGGASSAAGSGATRPAARSIDLNLFADVDVTALLDHVEVVGPLGYAWVGTVPGAAGGEVVLAVSGGVLTGSMTLGGRTYSVRQTTDSYLITEINSQVIPHDDVTTPRSAGAAAMSAPLVASAASSSESGDAFDLLLYYTASVKSAAGGTAALNSFITGSIAQVNAAYAASGVGTRVRLVAALELGYAETGSTAVDLPALRANPEVRAARDRYGADVVSMLVGSDPTSSGRSYITVSQGRVNADAAYSVVVYYPWIGYIYSLAHELGHTFGCLHEQGNNGGDDTVGAFPYSLGYTDQSHGFHDVMSYGLGCPNCVGLNQFSNPVVSYQGVPVGSGAQDSARTINATRAIVANYRSPAGAAGSPSAPTGLSVAVSGSSVSLSWVAAAGDPTAYVIEAGLASGLANLGSFPTNSVATTFSASGVAAGTYYVRVKATNAGGTSDASNEAVLIVR